jgi:hypothetical protein
MSDVPENVPINASGLSSIDQTRPRGSDVADLFGLEYASDDEQEDVWAVTQRAESEQYNRHPFEEKEEKEEKEDYHYNNFFIQRSHPEEQGYNSRIEMPNGDTSLGPIQGPMLPTAVNPPIINTIQMPDGPIRSHMIINNPSAYNPNSFHVFRRVIPCPVDIPVVDAEPVTLQCCVCMTNQVNTMIEPCCHASMCGTCAEEHIRRDHVCPICRRPISRVHRLYLSFKQHSCPEPNIRSIDSSTEPSCKKGRHS